MKLVEFIQQFGSLGDEFLVHFAQPFLVEEGQLDDMEDQGAAAAERQVFYLNTDGEPLVIGRRDGADITIRDTNVSSRHAHLSPPEKGTERWTLTDLGSTNGTFLNGAQVVAHEPHPLRDEAVIAFGPARLFVFLHPQSFLVLLRRLSRKQTPDAPGSVSLAATTDVMATVALDDVTGADDDEEAATDGEPLTLVCEPFDPTPLPLGAKLVVGRSGVHATLVLPHPLVSRKHAEIERTAEGVFVRDLHSANGTFIGGTKVGASPVQLLPGKALRIGDFQLVLKGRDTKAVPVDLGQTVVVTPNQRARRLIKGDLAKVPLEQLLAGVEEKQKSGTLTIRSGELHGQVGFKAGRPIDARTNEGHRGEAAVMRLLECKSGTFEIDAGTTTWGKRTIERGFSDLLLDELLS